MNGHGRSTLHDIEKTVAIVRLDDGKANALSPELIAAIQQAFDRAEREARALLLVKTRLADVPRGPRLPALRLGDEQSPRARARGRRARGS
jgi:enoyl-CoA hydratase/carnithine racemase